MTMIGNANAGENKGSMHKRQEDRKAQAGRQDRSGGYVTTVPADMESMVSLEWGDCDGVGGWGGGGHMRACITLYLAYNI
jgi:hypothetical protein